MSNVMSNRKIYIIIPMIIFTIMTFFNNPVYAGDTQPNGEDKALGLVTDWIVKSTLKNADDFVKEGAEDTKFKEGNIRALSSVIYDVLLTMGIVLAFIVGAILAIKFITSGLEGKAEVKQLVIPYIVGLVVIFGAFTIWKIVLTILQD